MSGEYAVVTGADHGVGLALAEGLARRGYRVLAGYLLTDEHSLGALAEQGLDITPIRLNLCEDQSVWDFADAVKARTDRVEVVYNNAGILGDMGRTIADPLSRRDIRQVIEVNAIGTLMVTNALWPLIVAGERKTIVNISSEAGSIQDCYRTGWFGYCMSKAANNMQGALVHNSLRPLGGQVIQMHPGHVATWMRGYLDRTAPLTPAESAAGILHVTLDTDLPVRERPLFLDYSGEELNY